MASARLSDPKNIDIEQPGEQVDAQSSKLEQENTKFVLHQGAEHKRCWNGKMQRGCQLVFMSASAIILTSVASTALSTIVFPKENYVNENHELVDSRGIPIHTVRAESFSTLVELPAQGPYFLEKIRSLSIHTGGQVQHFTISGFRWSNLSYVELETTRGRDVIIAAGKAFLRDTTTGKILHMTVPASDLSCGRRLADRYKQVAHSYSWEGMMQRYHEETSVGTHAGSRRWRRLDKGGSDKLSDLYEWFGALISSEAAQGEAEKLAAGALDAALCDYNTRGLECAAYLSSTEPKPPQLSTSGLNRILMSGSNELWLLYLDFSDWHPHSGVSKGLRKVKSKLVSGVGVQADETSEKEMRVTENLGSSTFLYQMAHPAVDPIWYNVSALSSADQGLGFAEKVLESADYDMHKGGCQKDQSEGGEEEVTVTPARVDFNCDDGTFTWSVAGWRIRASSDGRVQALVFANVTSDDSFTFRVLSIADGGDRRSNYLLSKAFQDGAIFRGCPVQQHLPKNTSRHLQTSDLFGGRVLPDSNWCGPGQCAADVDGCRDNYCLDKYDGDWACRRHDACAKYNFVFGVAISACSCNKDLYDGRGTGNNALTIARIFGPNSFYPCIQYEEPCARWGYVSSGSQQTSKYFGITQSSTCDVYNYRRTNKYTGVRIENFGYRPQVNGYSVHSRENWPGCVDNTVDAEVPNAFR